MSEFREKLMNYARGEYAWFVGCIQALDRGKRTVNVCLAPLYSDEGEVLADHTWIHLREVRVPLLRGNYIRFNACVRLYWTVAGTTNLGLHDPAGVEIVSWPSRGKTNEKETDPLRFYRHESG